MLTEKMQDLIERLQSEDSADLWLELEAEIGKQLPYQVEVSTIQELDHEYLCDEYASEIADLLVADGGDVKEHFLNLLETEFDKIKILQ